MSSEFSQLLLTLLFVTVGFIVGALITVWWFERNRKHEKAEQEAARLVVEEGENTRQQKYREVVRLWRDRKTNRLVVDCSGKVYPNLSSLSDEQRQSLESVIREWAVWLGLGRHSQKTTASPPQPAPVKPVPVSVPQPVIITPVPQAVPPAAPEDSAAQTMVAQINEIVQSRLPGSVLAGHAIRIIESPRDGVVVWVNGTRYIGVDEVADPQVRDFLHEAVAEWEKRAG